MRAFVTLLVLILLGAAAYAAETINYTYDARGRVVQVNHSGTVNHNVVTNYTLDKADNRNTKDYGDSLLNALNPQPPALR